MRNKTKPIKNLRKKSFEESKESDLSLIEEIKQKLEVLARQRSHLILCVDEIDAFSKF